MKTIQIDKFGGPEVLHPAEAPDPHPGRGQVRVRVRAIGVNPIDAKIRSGAMEATYPTRLPAVLGNEVAGVVDEVGEGVKDLAVGDEVFGLADGAGYAELALASVVAKKPEALSWEIAASLSVAGETATRVLDELNLKSGETLLIHGGAGVVGSVAVQLARQRGVRVIATGNLANQEYLQSLGAVPLVYGPGLVARVRALGASIDAVFDAAGKGALPDSIELRGGKTRIITIADPAAFQLGVSFSAGRREAANVGVLRSMADLAASGKLKLSTSQTLPLTDAVRAHELIEHNHRPGKIVLKVDA